MFIQGCEASENSELGMLHNILTHPLPMKGWELATQNYLPGIPSKPQLSISGAPR